MDQDQLVNFTRTFLGDEFCLTCFKTGAGLTNQRDADQAIMALVATRKFKLEPGQCKKCGKTGIMLRAAAEKK